jgi:hypothetical protein
VGQGPAFRPRAVRRGPRSPGGPVEHVVAHPGRARRDCAVSRCGGDEGGGSGGHAPTVPAPGRPSSRSSRWQRLIDAPHAGRGAGESAPPRRRRPSRSRPFVHVHLMSLIH